MSAGENCGHSCEFCGEECGIARSHVGAIHGCACCKRKAQTATFPPESKLFVVPPPAGVPLWAGDIMDPPPGAVQSDAAALDARASDAPLKITFYGNTRAEVVEQARAWLAECDAAEPRLRVTVQSYGKEGES